jgi:hypothetical protein
MAFDKDANCELWSSIAAVIPTAQNAHAHPSPRKKTAAEASFALPKCRATIPLVELDPTDDPPSSLPSRLVLLSIPPIQYTCLLYKKKVSSPWFLLFVARILDRYNSDPMLTSSDLLSIMISSSYNLMKNSARNQKQWWSEPMSNNEVKTVVPKKTEWSTKRRDTSFYSFSTYNTVRCDPTECTGIRIVKGWRLKQPMMKQWKTKTSISLLLETLLWMSQLFVSGVWK